MQVYGPGFAKIYNKRWAGFACQIAPLIQACYETMFPDSQSRSVLDLCCGTGQMARHFLDQGYRVVGIDLSEPMLGYARENNREYIEAGQADFIHADVCDVRMEERFGLIVSTFDALNHLENMTALKRCFICARNAGDGMFVFDLNTRHGLRRWNGIHMDDSNEDSLLITRGFYDGEGDRAWTKITGFVREKNGLFERFDETTYNTVFDLDTVEIALKESGWRNVYFARFQDLKTPLVDPESEGRVFVVARRR